MHTLSFEDKVRQADDTALMTAQFHFFLQAITLSLVIPFIFFCFLLPLFLKEIYNELWHAYYWLLACFTALVFSEAIGRLSFGTRMGWGKLLILGVTVASLVAVPNLINNGSCRAKVVVGVFGIFLSLYSPALYRLAVGYRCGHPLTPLCFFLLSMTWGGTPTAISVAFHYALLLLHWIERPGTLVLAIFIWMAAPFLVKPIGWELVLRGAPQNKFTGPPLWVLYCDLAFGTLGLVLFVRTPTASLTYAASIVPALLLHLIRGARMCLSCCGRQARSVEARRAARLNIFLEAFAAVLGRATAYTVYFCMLGMRLLAGTDDPVTTRRSLLQPDHFAVSARSVQMYRRSPATPRDLVAAVFGLTLLWCSFGAFCWLLPRAWAKQGAVQPSAAVAPSAAAAMATRPHIAKGCQAPSAAAAAAAAWEQGAEPGAVWAQPVEPVEPVELVGWVLGGSRSRTQQQQYQVLVSFLDVYQYQVLAMVLFQFMICTLAVNMAESIGSDLNGLNLCGEYIKQ